MKEFTKNYISESISVKNNILNCNFLLNQIDNIVKKIVETYQNKGKVLLAGNGGSAADAQHLAAELVSKFTLDRKALNAIALTTNTSILTAVGNDYSHEYVFSRQIEAYGNKNDIYIVISTSGESKNIIKSIETAQKQGLFVIGLTGAKPCTMDKICNITIKVPSEKTPIIQESHIMLGHIICALVEDKLF